MPTYRKRPRRKSSLPFAGGGEQSDAQQTIARGGHNPTQRARELRMHASAAEQELWRYLRRGTVHSHRFRRQFPLGPYFADFCCLPVRLVIEVDGEQHAESAQVLHDERRTTWLNRNRFRVIRFASSDVVTRIENVLDEIERVVSEQEQLLRYSEPLGKRRASKFPLPLREGANPSGAAARIWGRGKAAPEPNAPSPASLRFAPPPARGGGHDDAGDVQ
jgi:very-short-patch-repair endonuclease